MRCTVCGGETGSPYESRCEHCRLEPEVQILTPEERERFNGITIDSDGGQEWEQSRRQQEYAAGTNQGFYIRQISFGTDSSLFTKVVIAAVIAAAVFFILPLALLVAGGLALFWFLFRLLRR